MSERLTIPRAELVRIVDEASRDLTENTRRKLLAVAETTDAVAVGWSHYDGVGCPAHQARRRNQTFQQRFDTVMAALFDAEYADEDQIVPFVLDVVA